VSAVSKGKLRILSVRERIGDTVIEPDALRAEVATERRFQLANSRRLGRLHQRVRLAHEAVPDVR
jgi:hypothetical protein